MKIAVRLFASYREAVGAARIEIPVADGADGKVLWSALTARYPALAALPAPAGYALNDEYVPAERVLRESDDVALIPPVSGGDGSPRRSREAAGLPAAAAPATEAGAAKATPADAATLVPAPGAFMVELTRDPISTDRVLRAVADRRAGAVVLFLGVVRDNARGRRVDYLTYEAYDALARKELERIAAVIAGRWPVTRVAMVHRTGRLEVGEISVAVAVSAPHRGEAFEAGRFAIDTLKQTVPIWKKEVWEGGEAWVGTEPTRNKP